MATVDLAGVQACPNCGATLVTERQAAAWCAGCEWNLDRYEAARRPPEIGWRWLDRTTYRVALRLCRRQFATLVGREIPRRGGAGLRAMLVLTGTLFLAVIATAVVAGLYLTIGYWSHPLAFAGVTLLVVAVALWPRLGRVDKAVYPVERADSPALFALIDQVAAAVGAPVPQLLVLDESFNAYSAVVGLRRRRVLGVGLQLWAVLPPQQRVALLAHELGHLVNGDSRRSLVTGMPVRTFGALAMATRPTRSAAVRRRGTTSLIVLVAGWITNLLLALLHTILSACLILALWITMRDSQRAEYLADEMAARAGGRAGAAGLIDTLLAAEAVSTVLVAAARRGGGAAQWRAAADEVRRSFGEGRLDRLRQLSVREQASLFASHPPAGLRARMIEAGSDVSPAVSLTDADSARIDAELRRSYERVRRDLVNS